MRFYNKVQLAYWMHHHILFSFQGTNPRDIFVLMGNCISTSGFLTAVIKSSDGATVEKA